jgi:ankyrin repeat protein
MVQFLIENGAAPDAAVPPFGHTPLFLAVRHGHHEVAQHLIRLGAALTVRDAWTGHSLLHLAASRGDTRMTGLLLSVNTDIFLEDRQGQTPRDAAARARHSDLEKILLKVMSHRAMSLT